jgi:hypothetical protein
VTSRNAIPGLKSGSAPAIILIFLFCGPLRKGSEDGKFRTNHYPNFPSSLAKTDLYRDLQVPNELYFFAIRGAGLKEE